MIRLIHQVYHVTYPKYAVQHRQTCPCSTIRNIHNFTSPAQVTRKTTTPNIISKRCQRMMAQYTPHTSNIFPGFMIQFGSKLRLICFMTPIVSGPSSLIRNSFFPIPMPCSPCVWRISVFTYQKTAVSRALTVHVPSISSALPNVSCGQRDQKCPTY